mmetsp:Transcript_53555/g.78444  ORF Transcript_53555/g.78444 Transcript_53555/m.78444 type:complete len:203 (-) Transcript_53555:317-925(-)
MKEQGVIEFRSTTHHITTRQSMLRGSCASIGSSIILHAPLLTDECEPPPSVSTRGVAIHVLSRGVATTIVSRSCPSTSTASEVSRSRAVSRSQSEASDVSLIVLRGNTRLGELCELKAEGELVAFDPIARAGLLYDVECPWKCISGTGTPEMRSPRGEYMPGVGVWGVEFDLGCPNAKTPKSDEKKLFSWCGVSSSSCSCDS